MVRFIVHNYNSLQTANKRTFLVLFGFVFIQFYDQADNGSESKHSSEFRHELVVDAESAFGINKTFSINALHDSISEHYLLIPVELLVKVVRVAAIWNVFSFV